MQVFNYKSYFDYLIELAMEVSSAARLSAFMRYADSSTVIYSLPSTSLNGLP